MDEIIQSLNLRSIDLVDLAWAALWQSTLLIGAVALVALALRRHAPAVRFWLWQIVAIKLLLMPLWTHALPLPTMIRLPGGDGPSAPGPAAPGPSPAILPSPEGTGPTADESAGKPGRAWPLAGLTWRSWLVLVGCAAVSCQIVRLLLQHVALSRLLGRAAPAGSELRDLAARLAARLGLDRAPAVLLGPPDGPLFVCGVHRPALVVPAGLEAALRPDQLCQALLHELAHVKRRDLLWGWPVEIARAVYFFHPLVYWVAFRLRLERELACDQLAMAASGRGPAVYIETLLDVVGHAAGAASLPAAAVARLDGPGPASPGSSSTVTGESR